MVIDRHTTAQVATLRSAKHELPLQTQHIDGRYVALGFRISVIFQANNKMIIKIIIITIIITTTTSISVLGHPVAQLVEALRYKPEGRGFDSRWCHWNFSLT